jgi:pimeloyl-ACP methyl ester carboxylesterase
VLGETPAEGWIALGDGALHYTMVGTGPVVTFAHGLGGNERSWWQQVPAFSAHYTCLTFSHRGFFPSRDDVLSRPRPHRYAADFTTMLDQLGIGETAIVAQSMGGWTAMEFALASPHRVSALVLCGTTGTLKHSQLISLAASGSSTAVQALRARGVHPAAGARMADEQPQLYEHFVEIDQSSGHWDRGAVREELDQMRVREPAEFAAVRCPTLALVGEEDVVCPPENVAILAQLPMRMHVSVVPQAGHSVYFENPSTFNDVTLSFLDEVRRGERKW